MPTLIHSSILSLAISLLCFACSHVPVVKNLRVVGTSDIHGYYSVPKSPSKPGGMVRLGAFIEAQKKEGRALLLVDSGDMWSGTLLSDRNRGALGVRLFNLVGTAAAALGNHEFDYLEKKTGFPNPFRSLKKRIQEANFPVLAANLVDRKTGKMPAWPGFAKSVVVKRGGFKIGIVGAITPETPTITFPVVGKHLRFLDPAPAIREEATRLMRSKKVDFVIVVAHIGGKCRNVAQSRDLSSCNPQAPSFRLARALQGTGVKAIFGGHTHRQTAHWVGGIAVVQAGRYGAAVAILDISQRDDAPVVIKIRPPKKLVGPASGPLASKIAALMAPFESKTAAIRQEALGARVASPLGVDRIQSSEVGTYLCDVALKAVSSATMCIMNSGGLRRPIAKGPLTYGRLYDVMPFGNHAALMSLTGRELKGLVRVGTSGAHGVFQVAGLKIRYDLGRDHCPTKDRDGDGKIDAHDRDRLISVTLPDGSPLEPDKIYKIVTTSFLATGGDGLAGALRTVPKSRRKVLYDQICLRDLIAAHLRRHRPLINSPDKPVMKTRRVVAIGKPVSKACP